MPFMLQMGSSNQLMFVLLLVCPLHGSEDLCHQKSVTASAELNIYLIKIVALQKMVFFFSAQELEYPTTTKTEKEPVQLSYWHYCTTKEGIIAS